MTNGDSPDRVSQSIHQIGVENFEHVLDGHAALWRHYEVSSHPTLVFANADGVHASLVGGQSIDRIAEHTAALIAR